MVELTVEVGALDEGNVHTQVAVVRRAIKAEVDGERNRGPCRVLCAAVEADLISLLPPQLVEEGLRLVLRCHSHDGREWSCWSRGGECVVVCCGVEVNGSSGWIYGVGLCYLVEGPARRFEACCQLTLPDIVGVWLMT